MLLSEVKASYVIWLREILHYRRNKVRLISGISLPFLWLVVLGSGLSSSLRFAPQNAQGIDYLSFIFPGVMGMTILFPSMFSAMSLVYDKEFGFFKEIFVTPVSRLSIVLGKTLGGATTTTIQASLMFILAPLVDIKISLLTILHMIPAIFIVSFTFSAFGVLMASRLKSTETFPLVMQAIAMPMFFLAGALFPLRGAPPWMNTLAKADPLTYGVDLLRSVYFSSINVVQTFGVTLWGRNITITTDIFILLTVASILILASTISFNRQGK